MVRILSWEDYLGLFRWAQCNHNVVHIRGKQEAGVRDRNVTIEAEGEKKYDGGSNSHSQREGGAGGERERERGRLWCGLKWEEGATDQGMQAASPSIAGKRKEVDSYLDLPEGTQACHRNFSSVKLVLKF